MILALEHISDHKVPLSDIPDDMMLRVDVKKMIAGKCVGWDHEEMTAWELKNKFLKSILVDSI